MKPDNNAGGNQTPATPAAPVAASAPVIHDATAALQAKEAEVAALKATLADQEKAIKAARTEKAKLAIQAAQARGALPANRPEIAERWTALIVGDEANEALLAALPGSPALSAPITASTPSSSVQVIRADVARAIQAYASSQNPMERGLIFKQDLSRAIQANEIAHLLRSGSIQANTLGTVAGALVAQRALEFLGVQIPLFGKISTDFSDEPIKFGQSVSTRLRGAVTAGSYHTTNGYVSQAVTTTDVNVTIDNHKFAQVDFDANEMASTDRNLFQEQAEVMFHSIGLDAVNVIYALITAAYTNATTQAQAGFNRGTVITVGSALNARGVPPMGRFMLLNSAYFGQLAQDSTIANFAAYQKGELLTEGMLPKVHGFEIIEAANLPANAINLTGFAGTPSSIAFAARLPQDYTAAFPGVDGGGRVSVVTNPTTGMSVQLAQFINHQMGMAYARAAWMFGAARGQLAAGQRIGSA